MFLKLVKTSIFRNHQMQALAWICQMVGLNIKTNAVRWETCYTDAEKLLEIEPHQFNCMRDVTAKHNTKGSAE